MLDEDTIKDRLKAQSSLDDADAVFAAALPAIREGAASGDWFAIKAPRHDDQIVNRATSATLNTRLAASFGADGDESETAGVDAQAAIARAILAEAASSDDRTVSLGGGEYEFQFATPKRGGRTQLRLRDPNAGASEDGEATDADPEES